MSNGEKKGKGCGCGCLGVVILALIIVGIAYGCSGNSNDEIDLEPYISKVQTLNFQLYDKFSLDTVSSEEKIAEANRIEEEITPDYEMFQERNHKDNEDEGDFNYTELHVYEAFGALRAECNAIREYFETGTPDKLEDVNKYHEAVLKDIELVNEQLNK